MPIEFLNNTRARYNDGTGKPLANGTVGVYLAGTSFATLATIWDTVTKDVELANPVTLSSSGEAEIWYDTSVDIQIKNSSGTVMDTALGLNPNAGVSDSAQSIQAFNLVPNGSFETDVTADGAPDSWTVAPYAGSSIANTSDIVTNGTKALEFNTSGAGTGGGLATSTKFPVTEGTVCSVAWSFFATHTSTLNTFQIKWYDEDNVHQSTSTLTMPASGSAPTSWTTYTEEVTADAAATQGEVVLTGISSGGANLSSKAYFDGLTVVNLENMVTLDGTQTLTNKTLTNPTVTTGLFTSPAIATPTITSPDIDQVVDSSGNEAHIFAEVASAVNEITETNAASGNKPSLNQTGTDDIGVDVEGVELHNGDITTTGAASIGDLTATGTVDIPSESGASRHFIQSQTASASATVDFDNVIDGTYKKYVVEVINATPVNDADVLLTRVQTGGSTWQTGAVYQYGVTTGATFIAGLGTAVENTSTDGGISCTSFISDPSSTSVYTVIGFNVESLKASASNSYLNTGAAAGAYVATTAVTGIRFYMSSGNIASGEFRLYGISA